MSFINHMVLFESFESSKNSNETLHKPLLSIPQNILDNKCFIPTNFIRVIPTFCSI